MTEDIGGRVQKLEQSLESLESQMREQIVRARAGATTVLVVGIIIAALIVAWLFVFTPRLKKELAPETLVTTIKGLTDAEEKVDVLIETMEERLKESAPALVDVGRELAMDQIPLLRKQIEGVAEKQLAMVTGKLDEKVDDIFDKAVAQHSKELGPFIDAALKEGAGAELEEEFKRRLEELIGIQLSEELDKLVVDLSTLEAHIQRLLKPRDQLSKDEEFERTAIERMLLYIDDMAITQLDATSKKKP